MPRGEIPLFGLAEKARQTVNRGFNYLADDAGQIESQQWELCIKAKRKYPYLVGSTFVVVATIAHLVKSFAESGAQISGGRKSP